MTKLLCIQYYIAAAHLCHRKISKFSYGNCMYCRSGNQLFLSIFFHYLWCCIFFYIYSFFHLCVHNIKESGFLSATAIHLPAGASVCILVQIEKRRWQKQLNGWHTIAFGTTKKKRSHKHTDIECTKATRKILQRARAFYAAHPFES